MPKFSGGLTFKSTTIFARPTAVVLTSGLISWSAFSATMAGYLMYFSLTLV